MAAAAGNGSGQGAFDVAAAKGLTAQVAPGAAGCLPGVQAGTEQAGPVRAAVELQPMPSEGAAEAQAGHKGVQGAESSVSTAAAAATGAVAQVGAPAAAGEQLAHGAGGQMQAEPSGQHAAPDEPHRSRSTSPHNLHVRFKTKKWYAAFVDSEDTTPVHHPSPHAPPPAHGILVRHEGHHDHGLSHLGRAAGGVRFGESEGGGSEAHHSRRPSRGPDTGEHHRHGSDARGHNQHHHHHHPHHSHVSEADTAAQLQRRLSGGRPGSSSSMARASSVMYAARFLKHQERLRQHALTMLTAKQLGDNVWYNMGAMVSMAW